MFWSTLFSTTPIAPIIPPTRETSVAASLGPGNGPVLYISCVSDGSFPQVYTSSKPLRIGYYEGDGYFQPSPSMKRAIQQTRKLLEDAGHTVGLYACGCLEMLSCSLPGLYKSLPISAFAVHETGTNPPCCKDTKEEGTCNSLAPKTNKSCLCSWPSRQENDFQICPSCPFLKYHFFHHGVPINTIHISTILLC